MSNSSLNTNDEGAAEPEKFLFMGLLYKTF